MSFRQIVVASILAASLAANVHDRAYYEEKFFNWMKTHEVKALSGEHFVQMLQNFADNDDAIEAHNSGKHSYTLGHNKFSHMGRSEWKAYVRGVNRPEKKVSANVHAPPQNIMNLESSVDWVAAGHVSGVKDQGQCGSCWAFSTVGALEPAYHIKNGGTLQTFSEQNLVSCDNRSTGGSDLGCKGGLMDSAFEWVQKNGGLCTAEAYPYVSGTTTHNEDCKQSSCSLVAGVAPTKWTDVTANSDSAFMSALAINPLSVAIEADEMAFQLYKGGVFDGKCGTNLDHGVVAVGYGTDAAEGDYYVIRNSWGASWGEQGYIRFARGGSMQKEGQCGVLMEASFPSV